MSPKTTSKDTAKSKSGGVAPDVIKVGNLTREPELGYGADNGTPYARAGLAVEHPAKGSDWKGELVTDFYEVTSFGTVAEHVAESPTKATGSSWSGKARSKPGPTRTAPSARPSASWPKRSHPR